MTKGFLASNRLRFYAATFLFLFVSQYAALAQDRDVHAPYSLYVDAVKHK